MRYAVRSLIHRGMHREVDRVESYDGGEPAAPELFSTKAYAREGPSDRQLALVPVGTMCQRKPGRIHFATCSICTTWPCVHHTINRDMGDGRED